MLASGPAPCGAASHKMMTARITGGLSRFSSDENGTVPLPRLLLLIATLTVCSWLGSSAVAATSDGARSNPFEASTSNAARRDAIRAMPLEKLDAQDKARVESVLADVSIFRRMPVKVVDCDPDLYLFLVRHPDVVVNMWEVLKVSKLQLRQTGPAHFQIAEASGTTADLEILYSSPDTHLIYGEGTYRGPLLARPVKGRGVLLLKSGYVRETDGRYYVTSRLDSFVAIEPGAVELITKAAHPLFGKTADNNFSQTVAFLGALSRTIEINNRGAQRLATQLLRVQPEVRDRFAELAAGIAARAATAAARQKTARADVANRPDGKKQR